MLAMEVVEQAASSCSVTVVGKLSHMVWSASLMSEAESDS